MSRNNLFQAAFGGEEPEKESASQGKRVSPDERNRLFADAFGREETPMPTPHLGQSWRVNNTRARGLSFAEMYALGELKDVPYRELPDWVIDGGYAEPTSAEKKYQQQQYEQTGLTQSERNQVFNAFAADVEILAEMSQREPLRDSAALDRQLADTFKRHGQDQILEALKEEFPEAAQYYFARLKVQEAEAQEAERAESADVAAEIRAAQEAIAAMNTKAADDLGAIPADVLQAELTRSAAAQTRALGDE